MFFLCLLFQLINFVTTKKIMLVVFFCPMSNEKNEKKKKKEKKKMRQSDLLPFCRKQPVLLRG